MPRKVAAKTDGKRFPSVRAVTIPALSFYTFREDDPVWQSPDNGPFPDPVPAFVRICPPNSATDHDIEVVKSHLEGARIRVLSRQKPQTVVEQSKEQLSDCKNIREVVLILAKEANTGDRSALLELVESTLAEVGL